MRQRSAWSSKPIAFRFHVSYTCRCCKGHLIGEYRPDLVVDDRVLVEIKSVERLIGVHQAQALAYMRLLKVPVGLILNFYSEVLRTGIRRLAI
jgi:GxxExxY protein